MFLHWIAIPYYCRKRKLERESVLSFKGQKVCADRGHQAGDQCWFVPGERTSQRISGLLFYRNSEDPIENALLCLFSFWLLWPAESRVEWRRERNRGKKEEVCRGSERRREAGRGERGALGVWGNESGGGIWPQTVAPFVFTVWSGCVPLVIF